MRNEKKQRKLRRKSEYINKKNKFIIFVFFAKIKKWEKKMFSIFFLLNTVWFLQDSRKNGYEINAVVFVLVKGGGVFSVDEILAIICWQMDIWEIYRDTVNNNFLKHVKHLKS